MLAVNKNLLRHAISFVVPALNEETRISTTVENVLSVAESRLSDYEILLINDGSSDSTGLVMESLAAGHRKVDVFHNRRNLGIGGAYKRGLREVQFENVMMIVGDNPITSQGFVSIFSAIGQADMVIPYIGNPLDRSKTRNLISATFTSLINLSFGLKVRYYNLCAVHRADLLRKIVIGTDGFAFQAEVLVRLLKSGCSYVEIPVEVYERKVDKKEGVSTALNLKSLQCVSKAIQNLLLDTHNLRSGPARKSRQN